MADIDAWTPIYDDVFMQVMAQAISRKNSGYYVISGCDVHENTPNDMDVIVDPGEILFDGAIRTVAGNNVSLTSDGSYPRFYVIYLDTTPTAQGYQGTAETVSPVGETSFRKMEVPKPGNSCPTGVILSIVYLDTSETEITNSMILDIAQYGIVCEDMQLLTLDKQLVIPTGYTKSVILGEGETLDLSNGAIINGKLIVMEV